MITVAGLVGRARYYASLFDPNVARAYLSLPRRESGDTEKSLALAIEWICRAQDAFADGGVARSYSLAYNGFFKRSGWIPSYPETTGYIIPTMFDYAHRTGRQDVFARAVRMADWESDVQMPNGAVQGGTIDEPPTPAVFNTGQVVFGWVRAHQETGDERYLAAARRAGDFLLEVQDADGAWRKSLTRYASGAMPSYTYNTRTAWAMLLLANATGNRAYRDAAVANVEFALRLQQPNGWLRDNCLNDSTRPLLHTIAYSLRGILEIGIALNEPRYISAVRTAADALLARLRPDGSMAGRFDQSWSPAASWSCLTGNAQMGTVWGRLYDVGGESKYASGVFTVNAFLQRVQWRGTGHPGLDGGISGAFPIHGHYGRFEVLNWAVKFFADSLMIEDAIRAGQRGPRRREMNPDGASRRLEAARRN